MTILIIKCLISAMIGAAIGFIGAAIMRANDE
jgi:NhaP-type Na+/H+ or K+/H+ antiporter